MEYLSYFLLIFDFSELLLTYMYFIIHSGLAVSSCTVATGKKNKQFHYVLYPIIEIRTVFEQDTDF